MTLLWARKGGAFRRSEQKRLRPSARTHSERLHYLERQFSIDETPAFHFKMHRPASLRWISCANPAVDFDDDDDERNYFKWDKEREARCDSEEGDEGCVVLDNDGGDQVEEMRREEEIDSKAEEFIARFYDQMKLQRQISYLHA